MFTVSYGQPKMASNSQAQACSFCGQNWETMGFSDRWRGCRCMSLF